MRQKEMKEEADETRQWRGDESFKRGRNLCKCWTSKWIRSANLPKKCQRNPHLSMQLKAETEDLFASHMTKPTRQILLNYAELTLSYSLLDRCYIHKQDLSFKVKYIYTADAKCTWVQSCKIIMQKHIYITSSKMQLCK